MCREFKKFHFAAFIRLDPSSALDFLWACSHIPRIWQGRDQKIPQVGSKAFIVTTFFFSYFFSADVGDSGGLLLVFLEENREVCSPAQFRGAH